MTMDIINGIELYSIHKEAYYNYKKEAKRGGDAPLEVIKRKLTALVINSTEKKRVFKNKFICRFGGFVCVANEDTKMIEVIYWDNEKTHKSKVSKEVAKKLKETYSHLGLTASGDKLLVA